MKRKKKKETKDRSKSEKILKGAAKISGVMAMGLLLNGIPSTVHSQDPAWSPEQTREMMEEGEQSRMKTDRENFRRRTNRTNLEDAADLLFGEADPTVFS